MHNMSSVSANDESHKNTMQLQTMLKAIHNVANHKYVAESSCMVF